MTFNENRIKEARADTLINQAPEAGQLALLYSIPIDQTTLDNATKQDFLKTVLYSARGTYTMLLSALRAFYKSSELSLENGSIIVSNDQVYFSHSQLTSAWGQDRLIELSYNNESFICHALREDVANNRIELNTAQSTLFKAAPFESINHVNVKLLPFRIQERQPSSFNETGPSELCTILVDLIQPQVVEVPPTYFREADNARTSDPFGGHVLDLFDSQNVNRLGNQVTGPYPLYYDGDSVSSNVLKLFKLFLAAGVHIMIRRRRTVS